MTLANRQAFPMPAKVAVPGMTYRQWLAGQIMAGMPKDIMVCNPSISATDSVKAADALIAELEKTK